MLQTISLQLKTKGRVAGEIPDPEDGPPWISIDMITLELNTDQVLALNIILGRMLSESRKRHEWKYRKT